MKRQLLFAMLCIVGALNASAQTDVTAKYLTNADFSSGTAVSSTVPLNTVINIDGWTSIASATNVACGLFAYGGSAGLATDDTPAPASSPSSGLNATGLCACNGETVSYTQDVTLEAGSYTVTFDVYNASYEFGSGKIIGANLFGFKENGGSTHYAPNNTFAIGQWTKVAVTFELTSDTPGKISMGYVASNNDKTKANENMPHLFVDNVKILKNDSYTDASNKVDPTGWTRPYNNDGAKGDAFNRSDGVSVQMQATYGNSTANRQIYQTVTGLDNGIYEAVVYAYSQMEWKNGGDWLTHDAGDVGYVFAEGASLVKTYINARRGPNYPADGPGIYTISGIKVSDGNLTIGYALDLADRTEWHAFQLQSLIYTNGLSLADYEASVKEWKDKIRAITALPPKYLENTNALLAVIYDTYSTVEDYEYAISTLESLYESTVKMEELYAEYTIMHNYVTAMLAVPYVENVMGAHADLESANVEPEMQYQQDVYNAIYALDHAAWEYVRDADPDAGSQFDITFFLTNPDVTKFWDGTWYVKPDGWFTDQNPPDNFQVMQNNDMGPGGEVFMEYWSGTAKTSEFVLYQQVNLPAGTYKMTGRVGLLQSDNGKTPNANMTFSANDTDGTQIAVGPLADQSVEFVNPDEDIVKIGIKPHEGNTYHWIGINNIHLYKTPPQSFFIECLESDDGSGTPVWTNYDSKQEGAGDVTLHRRLVAEDYNTLVLPFNVSVDEVQELFGAGTEVFLATSYDAAADNISLTTPDEGFVIKANTPCVIKPTEFREEGLWYFPSRTLVPSDVDNPSFYGSNVTMEGNYLGNRVLQPSSNHIVLARPNPNSKMMLYYVDTPRDVTGALDEEKAVYLHPTSCYFIIDRGASTGGNAKGITFTVDGEATGIATVENGEVKFYTGKIYDLSGREVKNPVRGIYIVDGKKVMIK